MRNVNSEYFSRRELSIRLLFIDTQFVFFNYDENWMNILSLMALRRNIRKAKNSAIFRDGNARVLTRNAVGHSARSADAHVCVWSDRSVCVYVDAANRYIALVQPIARIYTARLHVLPRDPLLLVAQQCAIASSAARRRYRLGEG